MAKRVSSWKQKKGFTILTPDNFDNRFLGMGLASDLKMVIGKTINVSLKDLTDDRSKQHAKLTFEINKVEGNKAYTKFKSFRIAPSYVRYKARKGMKKIDYITDLKTADSRVRIKVVVLADQGASKSQITQVKKNMLKILNKHCKTNLDQFVQLMLFGKLGTELYHSVKSVCPISRVEIEKIKVL